MRSLPGVQPCLASTLSRFDVVDETETSERPTSNLQKVGLIKVDAKVLGVHNPWHAFDFNLLLTVPIHERWP